jgi:hypothetical protein
MRYFKIDVQSFYGERIASDANGENIPNAEFYFNKISQSEILFPIPVFDYFFLESFDTKEYWEWKLCDVYKFTRTAGLIKGWLISEKLKLLLENYCLPNPYYFYPSKLLYKGEKLDYYIFQFTGKLIYKQTLDYVNYPASIFVDPEKKIDVIVNDKNNFLSEYDRIYKENRSLKKIVQNKKLVLKESLDFFPMSSLSMENIVSEKLKNAMEENSIEGFEFSELDYDVVVIR